MARISQADSERMPRGRGVAAARRRPRAAAGRALQAHLARRAADGEERLSSNAGFSGDPERVGRVIAFGRPRPVALGIAFALTAFWYGLNVPHPSPLDVLPFVWIWAILWLAISVVLELWRRHGPPLPTGRRGP